MKKIEFNENELKEIPKCSLYPEGAIVSKKDDDFYYVFKNREDAKKGKIIGFMSKGAVDKFDEKECVNG